MTVLLKNQTSSALHTALAPEGVTPRLARLLQVSAVRRDAFPDVGPDAPARVLAKVRTLARIPRLVQVEKLVSPRDAFAKYLFRGEGPDLFEAVRIPLLHRPDDPKYVVCISSQVGCAMGCAFCATARLGWRRNLSAWEMVDQVARIQSDSSHPVRGVVFMGMGEPMLNYDAVLTAAAVLSEPCGMAIAAKAITISTAGIIPGIRRFTAERHAYRLVVSLTSADPARRATLMPIEAIHPTSGLMQAIREYHAATGQRVTLAWTMIAGVNTRPEDARMLADLTRGLPIKLDLIDVNDPTGRYCPPSPEELALFRDALREFVAMPVARRYSGGVDIQAACGVLAATTGEDRLPNPLAECRTDA
jgi:23S rRNA (adenine2503-C2)-methyltransferase